MSATTGLDSESRLPYFGDDWNRVGNLYAALLNQKIERLMPLDLRLNF
jgi:hypothetical protein